MAEGNPGTFLYFFAQDHKVLVSPLSAIAPSGFVLVQPLGLLNQKFVRLHNTSHIKTVGILPQRTRRGTHEGHKDLIARQFHLSALCAFLASSAVKFFWLF